MPNYLLNVLLCVRPLTFIAEVLHFIATATYIVKMPPVMVSMMSI